MPATVMKLFYRPFAGSVERKHASQDPGSLTNLLQPVGGTRGRDTSKSTVDKLFLGPRRSGRTNARKDSKIKQKIVEDFLLSCYVLLAVVASGGL